MNPLLLTLGKPLFDLIDKVIPDPAAREAAKLALQDRTNEPLLKQIEVNIQEASHPSWFVAGWRPAVGWVCAFSLAYAAVLSHLMASLMVLFGVDPNVVPEIDTNITMTVLMGLLGLGGLRTFEKYKGADQNHQGLSHDRLR